MVKAEKDYKDFISTCNLDELSTQIEEKEMKMKEISEKQSKLSGMI